MRKLGRIEIRWKFWCGEANKVLRRCIYQKNRKSVGPMNNQNIHSNSGSTNNNSTEVERK